METPMDLKKLNLRTWEELVIPEPNMEHGRDPDEINSGYGGYINDHFYKVIMKYDNPTQRDDIREKMYNTGRWYKMTREGGENPMHDSETAKKIGETRKRKIATGEIKPAAYYFTDEVRKKLSEQKKGSNNPLAKNPELTSTAKPVIVTFEDDSTRYFEYAKKVAYDLGVSYSSVKNCIKNNKPIKKHGIKSIVQVSEEKK